LIKSKADRKNPLSVIFRVLIPSSDLNNLNDFQYPISIPEFYLRNNVSDNSICGFDEMLNDEGTETHIEGNFCSDETDLDTTDPQENKTIPGFSIEMLFICLGIGIYRIFKRTPTNIHKNE